MAVEPVEGDFVAPPVRHADPGGVADLHRGELGGVELDGDGSDEVVGARAWRTSPPARG
jgi:hypothetical protein